MHKIRFSILLRVLSAFSVLILGYLVTIMLTETLKKDLELRLDKVSYVLLPIEKHSINAENSFDNMLRSFNDGVLMGELRLIDEAEVQFMTIEKELSGVLDHDDIPVRMKENTQEILALVSEYFKEARYTYSKLAMDDLSPDILESARRLNDQSVEISSQLVLLTEMLSSYLSDEIWSISRDMADIQFINRILFFVVLILSFFICVFIIKIILLKPIGSILKSSDQIANGNLLARVSVHTNDELGDLSNRFNIMAKQLYNTVSAIQCSYVKMTQSNIELENRVENVFDVIDKQSANLDNITLYLTEITKSIQSISESINDLYENAEDTATSVLKMSNAITGVLRIIEDLDNITEQTAGNIARLASNIKRTSENSSQLNSFAENISASMIEMEQSTKQVEIITKESLDLTEQVSIYSEDSIKVVEQSIKLMENVRNAVCQTAEDLQALKAGSIEIGNIIVVINDITEQTNLLSLNAAIIAAHAGENGKGFSVVADEIRNLSENTKVSTKEIEKLIKGFQNSLIKSVASMAEAAKLIDQGANLGLETGNALQRIARAAVKSGNIAREIVRNTKEQTESQKIITKDVNDETSMIKEMDQVLKELAVISENIFQAVDNIKSGSKHSRDLMIDQTTESRQISEAVTRITNMIDTINRVSYEQKKKSDEIMKLTGILNNGMNENLDSIQLITEALSNLKKESLELKQAISRFRIGD